MADRIPPELDDPRRKAEQCLKNHEFYEAIEVYQYIIKRFGDNNFVAGRANANIGEILCMFGLDIVAESYQKLAEIYFIEAVNCDPGNPYYHYLLGRFYSNQYRWEQAIAELKIALAKEPDNRDYLEELGIASVGFGDKKTGIDCLLKAIEISPKYVAARILIGLSVIYLELADFDQAQSYVNRLTEIIPDDIMTWAMKKNLKMTYGKVKGNRNQPVNTKERKALSSGSFTRVYELKITPMDYPDKHCFVEIQGNQTLVNLHEMLTGIFKRPINRNYMFLFSDILSDEAGRSIIENTPVFRGYDAPIAVKCRRLGQKFLYIDEDGELSSHEIVVLGMRYEIPSQDYPRVVEKDENLICSCSCELSLKLPTWNILDRNLPIN